MIVVGGDNLIDLIQTDRSDTAVSFAGARGGSAYNTAFAAGRQGAKVGFISPFSTDTLGQFLKEETDKSGVVALAADVDAPSSLAVVTVNNGQPSYQFYRAGTADRQVSVDSINANFPADAQLFHIASLALIPIAIRFPAAMPAAPYHCGPMPTELSSQMGRRLSPSTSAASANTKSVFVSGTICRFSNSDPGLCVMVHLSNIGPCREQSGLSGSITVNNPVEIATSSNS